MSMLMKMEIYLHVSLRTCNIKFRQRPPSGPRVRACGRTSRHAISLTRFVLSTSCKQRTMTYHDDFRCVFIDYSRGWRTNDSGTILNMHLVGWFILFLRRYINWMLRKLQTIKDEMIRNDSVWQKLQQVTVSCFNVQWLLYFTRFNIKQHGCFAYSVVIDFVSLSK